MKADARVIAATHRDLAARVKEGAFRQDLFYRVNVVRLQLPPLRQRREDIPLLVERLIERLNRVQGRRVPGVSRAAMALLMAHDYPGNIRELENLVEHAFVLCGDEPIAPKHLPPDFAPRVPRAGRGNRMAAAAQAVEAQAILDALKRRHHNRAAAAQDLGIHKSTFFRKVKALHLELPPDDGRSHRQ